MKLCIVPGTFDPITIGHADIIERASDLFDRVIVAVLVNAQKTPLFPLERRKAWIAEAFAHRDNISVDAFSGLLVDYARSLDARAVVRGIRGPADYEYEATIAALNHRMLPQLETVFLSSRDENRFISSTIVRELITHDADLSGLVPASVREAVQAAYRAQAGGGRDPIHTGGGDA